MAEPHLIRLLSLRAPLMRGKDVHAVRRAAIRFLGDDTAWRAYRVMPEVSRRTFGLGMKQLVRRVEAKAGMAVDGKAGPGVDRILRKTGAYDSVCDELLREYAAAVEFTYCYPHPAQARSTICQELHETAGLDGNWSYDFCCPGGTFVLAVQAGEVTKISGRNPNLGADQAVGIFGYSIHYATDAGNRWFSTHYGSLYVSVGQRLKVGTRLGLVGNWPNDPGRSHTHLGVTSPKGEWDAKRTVEWIAHGPRINYP